MSDQTKQILVAGRADPFGEQLSALVDGELAHDQVRFLLRSVEAESDLARRWSSYHVISATLRREVVALPLRADFSKAILGRIEADGAGVPVVRRGHGAVRWLGGGAIAAAVAVVALVVSGPVRESRTPAGRPTIGSMVAQSAPAARAPSPYLPLLAPQKGRVMPVDETVLSNLYSPDGSILQRDYLSQGTEPYVLYVNPQTRRVENQTPFPVQSGAAQK